MRCDDVFEILTSSPFPSGAASDADVERHLASCHECRCFAEALRPVGPSFLSDELPQYRGELGVASDSEDGPTLAERVQSLVQFEQSKRQASQHRVDRAGLARFIAACAAACCLGAAAAFGGPFIAERFAMNSTEVPSSSRGLDSRRIAAACDVQLLSYVKSDAAMPANVRESKDACCLKCHGGGETQKKSRSESIGLVVMSCQKCHQEQMKVVRL